MLAEQVKETSAKLADARAKLDAFKEKSGTDSLEQQMQLRLDGVAKFEDDRETAKKELSEVDAELAEIQTILGGGSVAKTLRGDSRSQVEAKQTDRLARRKALVARIGALSATIDRYQKQATALSGNQSEEQQIALEVGLLEDNYKMLVKSYEEARIAAAQALSEIRVLHPAIRPRYPDGPVKLYYAGGGALTGLLLALGIVLLIDYMDHRVRSADEIEHVLGVAVLASVPHATLPARATLLLGSNARHAAGLSWGALPPVAGPREDHRHDS
jgi:uncharacterized protein involved in exopolysaccharide biosynthesis